MPVLEVFTFVAASILRVFAGVVKKVNSTTVVFLFETASSVLRFCGGIVTSLKYPEFCFCFNKSINCASGFYSSDTVFDSWMSEELP